MPKVEKRIHARVKRFAEQLVGLIRQSVLQELSGAVGGRSRSKKPEPASLAVRGRGRGGRRQIGVAPARPKGAKRSTDELERLTGELETYVRKYPGQRIEQIGKGMGVATKELKLPVMKLTEAGKLKTKGQKRATKYLPR
jgi:hypothetical protein